MPSTGVERSRSELLHRGLGRADVVALTLTTIGAGIFTLPAALAAGAGNWSLGVLLGTLALVSVMALCMVEVASRYDVTGGPMVYAGAAFGPLAGFVVGWLMYLSRLAAFGAIAAVMLDYGSGLWPALDIPAIRTVVVTVGVVGLAAINLRGVVWGAQANNVLTVAKLLPLILLALAGLRTVTWTSPDLSAPASIETLSGTALIALFACVGFEAPTILAGEMRNPRRDLPRAILGGLAGVGALYTVLLLVCVRNVPDLAHARRPLADAAQTLFGTPGATLMTLTAVFSCAGTLSVGMLALPRLLYALAAQGDLPRIVAGVNTKWRTPSVAIATSAVIVWTLTVSGTFVYLATFSAMARLLTYASTCAALLVLRRRDGPAPIAIPCGALWGVLALVYTVVALGTTSGTEVRDLTVAVILGMAGRSLSTMHRVEGT